MVYPIKGVFFPPGVGLEALQNVYHQPGVCELNQLRELNKFRGNGASFRKPLMTSFPDLFFF